MIPFFHTNVAPEARRLVDDVLASGKLSEGEMVQRFEKQLQILFSLPRRPLTVCSGTAGLHLALAVAGVGPGDEVILPAQTFIATGLAILMLHAKPVFADIQPATGNLCPRSAAEKITSKTKAILPVHWGGLPCDMDEINDLAKEHGLKVIEDAAHALGAYYKRRPIGSISDFTVFSFQAIKHLTTGDGGAISCLREIDAKRVLKRRWFDIDRASALPTLLGERDYDATELGYKYHMNDVAAAIGLGNLERVPSILQKHRAIARFYRQELQGISGIHVLEEREDRQSACWFFTLLVEERERFARALKERGVPASVVHLRIDRNSLFGGKTPHLPGQELFEAKQIALPIHAGLSEQDTVAIVDAIRKGW